MIRRRIKERALLSLLQSPEPSESSPLPIKELERRGLEPLLIYLHRERPSGHHPKYVEAQRLSFLPHAFKEEREGINKRDACSLSLSLSPL